MQPAARLTDEFTRRKKARDFGATQLNVSEIAGDGIAAATSHSHRPASDRTLL